MKLRNLLKLLCMLICTPVCADSIRFEQVRDLVEEGKILSLEEILSQNPSISEARLLDIELEQEDSGRLVYEFQLLNANDRVVELEVDAATGELLHEEFEE